MLFSCKKQADATGSARESNMAKLIIKIGDVVLREATLGSKRTTIGRKAENDIQIENLAISGAHAAITPNHDGFLLEDLNSTNGTYINEQKVLKHRLQNNDVIQLGKYDLTFIGDASPQAAPVQASPVAPPAVHAPIETKPLDARNETQGPFPSADLNKLTHYQILQVSNEASEEIIRLVYMHISQKLMQKEVAGNPDAESQLKIVKAAFEALTDDSARKLYDLQLKESHAASVGKRLVKRIPQAKKSKKPVKTGMK